MGDRGGFLSFWTFRVGLSGTSVHRQTPGEQLAVSTKLREVIWGFMSEQVTVTVLGQ